MLYVLELSRILSSLVAYDTEELSFDFMSHVAGREFVVSSVISKLTESAGVFSISIRSSFPNSRSSVTDFLTTRSIVERLAARMAEVDEAIPFDASSFGEHSPPNEVVLCPAGATTGMTTTYTLLGPCVVFHSEASVLCVFYIDRRTVRLPIDTVAVVATTAFETSPYPGVAHGLVGVPAPVEGWKVGDTFPAGSE